MPRAFPYTPFAVKEKTGPRLPFDSPTLATRSKFGDSAYKGIEMRASRAIVVPVESPRDSSAIGGGRGGSKVVTGGTVKGYITGNDTIRPALIVALNLFSPTSHADDTHRIAASGKIPPAAIRPSKDFVMPQKFGMRGSGGHYTYPAPNVTPAFLTSSEWLHKRILGK